MRKIALVLALALVLGCMFVMVGCTQTPAESSDAPADSSETPAESSEEPAESSEEPAESSEEPAESSEEPAESSEEPAESSEEPAESTDTPADLKLGKEETLWVIAIDPAQEPEGAGVIHTVADTASGWAHHVAFAPIESIENAYEIVAIALGEGGNGQVLPIPEGGFVWTHNVGNNWPDLMKDKKGDGASGAWYDDAAHLTMPNYASAVSTAAWDLASTWSVGDRFVISGVDIASGAVPTTTPDAAYTDADYVCTAKIAPIVG